MVRNCFSLTIILFRDPHEDSHYGYMDTRNQLLLCFSIYISIEHTQLVKINIYLNILSISEDTMA